MEMDQSKAFDSVPRDNLFNKMVKYGLDDTTVRLTAVFNDCTECVLINGSTLTKREVLNRKCHRLCQGSILVVHLSVTFLREILPV